MVSVLNTLPPHLNSTCEVPTDVDYPKQTKVISALHLASYAIINPAYIGICGQRKERGLNNSIWQLRHHWPTLKPKLQNQLLAGAYGINPLPSHNINGELISSWDAMDALVLKALALTIQPLLSASDLYSLCTHLKDSGGIDYHFNIVIPKGSPLSPLNEALYLKPLDEALSKHGFYIRFMDDWLIMVKTRHQLRKIIKLSHKILESRQLNMHPDKTFLGCIKKGFDFLGVYFCDTPGISNKSLEKHYSKLARRYTQSSSAACIGRYIKQWSSWCKSLLNNCKYKNFHLLFWHDSTWFLMLSRWATGDTR